MVQAPGGRCLSPRKDDLDSWARRSPFTRPLTQRDCRDLWYAVARIRKTSGDTEGARRANRAAQAIGGDARRRHDQ